MALLEDYQDPFGGPRVAREPDFSTGHLTADLDLGGFDLLGLDLNLLGFGIQALHTVYAGPKTGSPANPAFRTLVASEVGAQPHSNNLDVWSDLESSVVGRYLTQLSTPLSPGYIKVLNGDSRPIYRSPSEVADDIQDFITEVAGIKFDTATAGTHNVIINADLNVDGDVTFSDAFSCGPDSVVFTTLNPTTLTLPESGTLAIVDPDTGWSPWVGTGSKATRTVSTATTAQCAAAIKSIIDGLILKEIFTG